ncbi:MAG: serine/threonine-protein kinase [Acidobacteria bacterium]|nr:serine/threonine-protein kinase [Acidobacteriota bacterium]
MRLSAGSTLGPYEISGAIGAGGMGEVYRARDTRLGRDVAIKVLPQDVAADAERLARFQREACSASALNHPNIVTVHDFTSRAGETYLVMELVRGESLRDIVSRGPLPLKKLLSIAAGVADGLAAAHAAGIVHRDLKPENVMVTSDGTPKILDFGLVKGGTVPVDLNNSPTELEVSRDGVILGTTSYMSPEQGRGGPMDFRSDQFSLGLMLHEMASGRHPFHRSSSIEMLAGILNAEPEPLSDSIPQPFVWIVERCLEKDPAHRYGSTADLAHDLARLRDRAGTTVIRPVAGRESVLLRKSWILAGTAAVLVTLAAMTMMLVTARRRPPENRQPIQVSVATPEIEEVYRGEVAMPVVISPDGRYLVVYGAGAAGTLDLWLHDLRSGATKRIAEKAFAAGWSSDSKAIAYFAEGKLKTVAVEGGPPRIVCDARPEGTPAWQGDTILFAQYSKDPGLYRVSASGGTPERIIEPGADKRIFAWWPEFLPDGKRFLYLTLIQRIEQEVTHELFVGSLDGAAPQRIAAIDSRAVFAEGHLLYVRDGTLLAHPFDATSLRFTGEAKPLLSDLHYFRNTGLAAFSVSENGLLAWSSTRPAVRLAWLDRGGIEVGSIGRLPGSDGGRLSRDGRRYVVGIVDPAQGVSDIWIHDLARDSRDRVTFKLVDEEKPVWGPDGTIYFRSDGGGGPPDIFKLSPGQTGQEIVYSGPGVNEPHDVSADGKWLLFIDYTPPVGADINVLPLAPGGAPRPFVATPFQELSPRFSPDGRLVAYSSDVSGRPQVYVRAFEGNAPAVSVSRDGGTRPRWRPDGKELFFLAPGGRLMAVTVSGEFGVPRMLFQALGAVDYELAADGTRFLMHLEERSGDPPLHLLLHWRARLGGQQ